MADEFDPRVILCAWCGRNGRPQAAARSPDDRKWEPVSHDFALAVKRAGLASHGVCPECRQQLQSEVDGSTVQHDAITGAGALKRTR